MYIQLHRHALLNSKRGLTVDENGKKLDDEISIISSEVYHPETTRINSQTDDLSSNFKSITRRGLLPTREELLAKVGMQSKIFSTFSICLKPNSVTVSLLSMSLQTMPS